MDIDPRPSPEFSPGQDHRQVASRDVLYRIFEFAPDAIFLADDEGIIVRANEQAELMFGYSRSDLIGQYVELLIPRRLAARHVGYRAKFTASPHSRPMGIGLDLFGKRSDGTEFPVEVMLSPIEIEQGRLMLAVVRDVTERKRIEAVAREAREMYFKEVHHRVKNNLQVISSLLYLQSVHTSDPVILGILNESRSRVKSIALIHEKLYRSSELVKIDFAEYVRDLVADLYRTYGVNQEGIAIATRVEDVRIEIDTAVPCGLIINELVSNALKHAFTGRVTGTITVDLRHLKESEFLLEVRDDGVGLPKGFDARASNSLGLRLVSDLTRQLDGTMAIDTTNGTLFRITFREIQYKERT